MLRIRIRKDPHQIERQVRIRIRINLQITSQNVWNMSLFEHFFKVLILYMEARIRICIKVKDRIRIRICNKVSSRIRIRINVMRIRNTGFASANVYLANWNLFSYSVLFSQKNVSLYFIYSSSLPQLNTLEIVCGNMFSWWYRMTKLSWRTRGPLRSSCLYLYNILDITKLNSVGNNFILLLINLC